MLRGLKALFRSKPIFMLKVGKRQEKEFKLL
nr:MAG TPA: hypothetical protein [Caudoviricetes sp.]